MSVAPASDDRMVLSYRLRLHPTRQQRRALESVVEQQRQLYNAALEERIGAWRRGVSISVFDQSKSLTQIRADDPAFAGVVRRIQRHTLDRLDRAYKAFFRRAKSGAGASSGFPKFKGREYADSFGFDSPLQIKWDGKRFRFSGVPGGLRVARRDRERLPPMVADQKGNGSWKGVQFKKIGQTWWATVQVLTGRQPVQRLRGPVSVGVDWGTSALAVLSTGHAEPPLLPRTRAAREIIPVERKLARARKGSRRRMKVRRHKQAIERRIANRRRDRLDKLSKILVTQRPMLAIEDIGVQKMTRSGPRDDAPASLQRRRNREALESAPYLLRQMIQYKGQRYGCDVRLVPAAYTTQACSGCGVLVPKELSDALHECPSCGLILPRKVNSARVILKRSMEPPPGGSGDRAGRGPAGAAKAANGGNGRRRPRNTSAGNGADGSRSGEPDFPIAHAIGEGTAR